MNNGPKRRTAVMTSALLVVALIGVIALRIDSGSAQQIESTSAENESTTESMVASTPSALPSLMKVGAALAVVVVCIYFGLWMLKKFMGRKYSGGGASGQLEIIESMYVAPKKTVSLIRVADKTVLIGVTESGVNMLTEFDETQSEKMIPAMEAESEPVPQFAGLLKTASDRLKTLKVGKKRPALES